MARKQEEKIDVLRETLKESFKERADERKAKAKELISKVLDLQKQMTDAAEQFNFQKEKWEKGLGEVMLRLNNMAAGRPLNQGDEKKDDGSEK